MAANRTAGKKATAKKKRTQVTAAQQTVRGASSSPITKAAAKQALDRESRAIATLRKDLGVNAWQIGRRLLQIQRLGLAEPAGFASTPDYAERIHGIGRSTAYSYMRVAEVYPESAVRTWGVEKLDRALVYIARTPEDETPEQVLNQRIRVPDAKGAVHEKRFADVSVAELRAAAAHEGQVHAQSAKAKRQDPNLAPHLSAAARANRALDHAVGKSNAARAELILHAVDGLVLFDLRGVPLARAAAALAAVKKALG